MDEDEITQEEKDRMIAEVWEQSKGDYLEFMARLIVGILASGRMGDRNGCAD